MKNNFLLFILTSSLLALTACGGKGPSSLLRQGQAPFLDFPLYVTGGPGKVWKFDSAGNRTTLVDNLNDPKGIATDKYNNLYVVEQGLGRLLKVNTDTGAYTVVADSLALPSVVAVDSMGEVYVAQEGANNVLRVSDSHVVATFAGGPTALAFGVNDLMLVGLYSLSQVFWGETTSASVTQPVNIGTDATGRVYVAEGSATGAKIYRFHQNDPSGKVAVADNLSGVGGFVVDPVGNIYISEAGASRILVSLYNGQLNIWASGVTAPEYMAFTQY